MVTGRLEVGRHRCHGCLRHPPHEEEQFWLAPDERFVGVGARVAPLGDLSEAVEVQLALEGAVLGVAEVFHQDRRDEELEDKQEKRGWPRGEWIG